GRRHSKGTDALRGYRHRHPRRPGLRRLSVGCPRGLRGSPDPRPDRR
ncbi:MAG: hypothetical protein AVDCRST_MAG87-2854, partial [uncultured Thermomicrobiales bacterium]